MQTTNAFENRNTGGKREGILYPLMLIAAIAVIVFSVVGIATMMGWMPSVASKGEPQPKSGSASNGSTAMPAPATNRPRVVSSGAVCQDCGVIESIRSVESPGEGSAIGAIGGAVVGGILGNQVGRGSGRTAATVVGAGAGAYAGHEIEKNVTKKAHYQVRVRMSDGTYRTFHQSAQPALAIGQKVRVTGQGIVAAG
jgi:outer membrane lipoprotein SlyB